ncbi:deoxycytidylate deaminase [Terrarubrum flagellatum]|uniref:deoxycytidylate deaminase n=1 Tax=Terrirubrum flagellatum TaxID=2895980 RepID=UPI003144D647
MTIDELMDLARQAAAESPNRVRQVGVVVETKNGARVVACNTFPDGVRDIEERHAGDGRFIWMEHAERNAIHQAARDGLALGGATMTTTLYPCIDCARAIVQSGVKLLRTPEPDFNEPTWGEAFRISRVILEEGGVNFEPWPPGNEMPPVQAGPAPKLYALG